MLYRAKEKNPRLNFKLIDENGLLDLATYSFAKDPIPVLLRKGISYSRAKKYLNILRVRKPGVEPFLDELEQELEKGKYLFHDPLGMAEISSMDVRLFRLNDNYELREFLNRKGIAYSEADELFDLSGAKDLRVMPPVYLFPNKFAQYMYVFSDIRKRLLDDPSLNNRIAIHAKDDVDFMYIKLLAPIFGIPYYRDSRRKLLTFNSVKKDLQTIFKSKSFALEPADDPARNELRRLIDSYELASFDFDFAYANLLEILDSCSVKEEVERKGVPIVTDFAITPERLTYILDFQFGDFYREFDDKNVYPDARIVEVGGNPSYALTSMDRQLKFDYLSFTDFPFLSRVGSHLKDAIYASQFIAELHWDKKKIVKIADNPDGVYTSAAELLFQADCLDRQFYHAPHGKIMSYDHSFKGIDRPLYPEDKVWSVTNLETYINCPFRYLMGKMLPEQGDSDFYKRAFGSATHKLFERLYHKDFDFETSFLEAEDAFKQYLQKQSAPFTERYETLLRLAKYWLSYTVPILKRWTESATIVENEEDAEQRVQFYLSDENGLSYPFSGIIDKIVITKGDKGKYCTILDYKTGSETFNPYEVFLGKSTQLPLYYWAIQQSENARLAKGAHIAGFGIQHIYFKTPKAALVRDGVVSENNLIKGSKLQGALSMDPDYANSIDKTAFNKYGELRSTGGDFLNFKYGFEDLDSSILGEGEIKYTIKDVVSDAKKSMVETIRKIKSGHFPIAPTFISPTSRYGQPMCSYCIYRDVCYRVLAKDLVSYYGEVEKKFSLAEEEEL